MKLLVNAPTGDQQLIEIGEGGSYFDPARVLWDERTDGQLPEITLGGMVRVGGTLVFDQGRKDQHDAAIAPKVPQKVTRRQARQALLLAGLLASVQPAIDAIADATERGLMQIWWDDSLDFERSNSALITMATALGLDSAAIDSLFVTAATL